MNRVTGHKIYSDSVTKINLQCYLVQLYPCSLSWSKILNGVPHNAGVKSESNTSLFSAEKVLWHTNRSWTTTTAKTQIRQTSHAFSRCWGNGQGQIGPLNNRDIKNADIQATSLVGISSVNIAIFDSRQTCWMIAGISVCVYLQAEQEEGGGCWKPLWINIGKCMELAELLREHVYEGRNC